MDNSYAFVWEAEGPKMLVEMRGLHGLRETPGRLSNPQIMALAKETGLQKVYTNDAIPWCGLAMAAVAKRAGKQIPKTPLWALSWAAEFGTVVEEPEFGDVLVFKRYDLNGKLIGGHVTLYVGEDATAYHCLGANQADRVNITRIKKERLFKAVRPHYTNKPASVRKIFLQPNGELSDNEQ